MNRKQFLTLGGSAALAAILPARLFAKLPADAFCGKPDAQSGLASPELTRLLDEIETSLQGKPFITVRARQLAAMLDNMQLAAVKDDLFVHFAASTGLLTQRCQKRVRAFVDADAARHRQWHAMYAPESPYRTKLDTSHTCPDWESILALGPKGLADRARCRRTTATAEDERVFLDAVIEVYEALGRLCVRWADVAARAGMAPESVAALRALAERPPQTLREALQLSLVYDRAQETEGQCVRSQGLFDRLYIGFYRADLAAGRETRASAKRLVADYFTRLYSQGHPNGKNIAFGGYDAAGKAVWNELTEIAIELHGELNRPNPKLTFRYGKNTPREQLLKVTRCLASGRTSVVFPVEETLYEMFRRRGKESSDLSQYVLVGCYEPGIGGREIIASMAAEFNLAGPFVTALGDGRGLADTAALERAYLRATDAALVRMLDAARMIETHWAELNPAPLMSGACRDAIANAQDYSQGGFKYNQSGVMCCGLGTVADAFAATKYLTEEAKLVTLAELAAILKADWKGHEELRLKALRAAPKWGNNDARADQYAQRIAAFVAHRINATPNGHGGTYQAGFWSIDLDIPYGKRLAATPDGRHAGEKLSRNCAATAGCGTAGPTALLASNAKLPLAEAADGHIADVIVPVSPNEKGAEYLADLLRGYAAMGGQCIHLNCFNSATLRAAMAHPEQYPDLQVRVCGWNVRWVDLSRQEQEHFLATALAQGD